MRISTNTMYEAGVARMNDLQSTLLKTQQQIATGRRILTPADDPVGAAQALNLSQGQSMNAQFASNRANALSSLAQEEGVLQSVTGLIQDLKSTIVQAGNPTMDDSQRQFLATDLRSRLNELVGLANSRDGLGNFMFGGYQIGSEPFSKTATGAFYHGDQGLATMQVDSTRRMAIADSGDAVFMNIPSEGTFNTASSNAALTVSPVAVVDARAPNLAGTQYDVAFAEDTVDSLMYYTVTTRLADGSSTISDPVLFDAAQPIVFDGRQISVTGTPADGNTISVNPAPKGSLFSTLTDVINLLERPGSGQPGGANLAHGLGVANGNVDSALDHVLAIRASVGSRLKEIDTLDNAGADKALQYAESLSTIQDLDYNQALSDLARQQVILQAAQQSFVKVSGLTLFDYL